MRALIPDRLRQNWLTIALVIVAAVLALDVVVIYFLKFGEFVHSDAASTILLGKGAMEDRSPIDYEWYFANGDVWIFGPHLYAMPFLALWGVCVRTLLAATVLGFALEIAALMWAYTKVGGDRRTALFATALTLIAWSRLHILFVYVELSYGFVMTLYTALFTAHALLFIRGSTDARKWSVWIGCMVFTLIASAQNPIRAVVFAVAPLVVACAWPWRGVSLRTRAITASAPVVGLVGAKIIKAVFLEPRLTYAVPSGHLAFVIKDASGMLENLKNMARGVVGLCGDMGSFGIGSAFGLALLGLSTFLVVRHAFARTPTPLRFLCIASLAQMAAVGGPMLIGNLVINPVSIRYLMPSLIAMFGLGCVIAFQMMKETKEPSRTGIAFSVIAPIAAAFTLLRIVGSYSLASESTTGQFAHSATHQDLADELTRRDLKHGFGSYWNAHLLTVLSNGKAKTCPATFGGAVMPRRWHTDTWCFDPKRLPDRFFVVASGEERDEVKTSIPTTLGTPADRFTVGNEFDVAVFRTADVDSRWLAPPIPDGAQLTLPLRIAASHPQIRFGDQSALEGDKLVSNGKEGIISFGPYIELPAGEYRVRWFGRPIGDAGEVGFDVYPAGAPAQVAERTVKLGEMPRDGGALVELVFRLPKAARGVELRTYSRGGARIALEAVELSR